MLRVVDGIRSTHNEDGGIVLDVNHGRLFKLNLVGARILALLELGRTETQITDDIARACGMNAEIVRTDVEEFIALLRKHRILDMCGRS
jgi:hypothetical protein